VAGTWDIQPHRKKLGDGNESVCSQRKSRGVMIYGTEISSYAGERLEKLYSISVFKGGLHEAEYPSEYFDVVTLYHVI